VEGFLKELEDTPYKGITLEEEERVPIALEMVFYERFIQRIKELVELTPTKMGDFLRAYYYMRFEIVNLKRILRGKYSGASREEINDYLIPMDPYEVENYQKLVEKETLEEVVEALNGTPYSGLSNRIDLYHEVNALWPLELWLNYIYASNILEAVKKLPRKARNMVYNIVAFETDIENILIAVKLRGQSVSPSRLEELFPATYRISIDTLQEISESKNLRTSIESLGSPYTEALSPIYQGDVALIRANIRRYKYEIATSARLRDEFGFNVIMAYLVYSELEKDNLVGLAWGKAQGLPSEELLKYIVIPRT
jgi:V/A-type H+-transporting ATPase subunit C